MPMPWKAAASVHWALQLYDLKKGVPWIRARTHQPVSVGPLCMALPAATRTMRIASNGQRTAHSAHPVQPGASCRVEHLEPQGSGSSTCSDSTWGGHTATHQPQPVQRWGSMVGRALGVVVVMWCGGAGSVPLERAPHKERAKVPP